MSDTVAAIDCGTNSIRLLVARVDGERMVDLDRRMTVVRLGEGVDRTGMLAADALDRTFAACRDYRTVIENLGATAVRFVATSASRDAGNAAVFAEGVEEVLGVAPEVISGEEEAELSFVGATRGLAHLDPVLVFDIGGGSTEFVVGDGDSVREAISVDMGCVRFHERYLRSDPPTPAELDEVKGAAERMMDEVLRRVDALSVADVIGLAGTVTTVAALALGLPEYDASVIQGSRVSTAAVDEVAGQLSAMSVARRLELPVMHPGRADVIASGATILQVILHRLGRPDLIVSEHDILDGLAWSLVS